MKLRPYQKDAVREVTASLKEHDKVSLVAPTGSGKTIMFSHLIQQWISEGKKVWVIVHLDILVNQTVDKVSQFIPLNQIGFIKGGKPKPEGNPSLIVASVQTLSRRRNWEDYYPDYVIFDESHITTWAKVIRERMFPAWESTKYLGVTATPTRLSKKEGYGDIYQKLIQPVSPFELQSMGFLSPLRYFSLKAKPDLESIKTVGGDFDKKQIKLRCDRPELVQNLVKEWKRITALKGLENPNTIAFCVSISHSKHLAEEFNKQGINAESVSSEITTTERNTLYKKLNNGEITVLTSVNVISIGFDLPSVEVGILARPTKSRAVHFQQIGRIMRISPGKKEGIIIDQAGNCLRRGLGIPENLDAASWDLKKGGDKEKGEPPVKECGECGNLDHISARICSNCETPYPIPEDDSSKVESSLEEIDKFARFTKISKQFKKDVVRGFRSGDIPIDYAIEKLVKKSSTFSVDSSLRKEFVLSRGYRVLFPEESQDTTERQINFYLSYLLKVTREKESADWFSIVHRNLAVEFGNTEQVKEQLRGLEQNG